MGFGGALPLGISTMATPFAAIPPAIRVASAPAPQNVSKRFAPLIAPPVAYGFWVAFPLSKQ